MKPASPLKIAIVTSGRAQKDIAAKVGIDPAHLSRIVHGLHCPEDLRQAIAREIGRHPDDLWPSMEQAA